jgi:hypothetical protein
MATFCPYCDVEIERDIYRDWNGNYWTLGVVECPKCNESIEVEVETIPHFVVSKSTPKNT